MQNPNRELQLPLFTQWVESQFSNADACREMGGEVIFFTHKDEDLLISASAYNTPDDEENVNWEFPTENSYKIVMFAHYHEQTREYVITTENKTIDEIKAEFISAYADAETFQQ